MHLVLLHEVRRTRHGGVHVALERVDLRVAHDLDRLADLRRDERQEPQDGHPVRALDLGANALDVLRDLRVVLLATLLLGEREEELFQVVERPVRAHLLLVPAARFGDLATRFGDAPHRLEVVIFGDLHISPGGLRFSPQYGVRATDRDA